MFYDDMTSLPIVINALSPLSPEYLWLIAAHSRVYM